MISFREIWRPRLLPLNSLDDKEPRFMALSDTKHPGRIIEYGNVGEWFADTFNSAWCFHHWFICGVSRECSCAGVISDCLFHLRKFLYCNERNECRCRWHQNGVKIFFCLKYFSRVSRVRSRFGIYSGVRVNQLQNWWISLLVTRGPTEVRL